MRATGLAENWTRPETHNTARGVECKTDTICLLVAMPFYVVLGCAMVKS